MTISEKREIRRDYIIVLLFVLASGCTLWASTIRPAGAFLLLLAAGLTNSRIYRKNRGGNNSVYYIYWIAAMCMINLIAIQSPYKDNSMMGYIVSLSGAYLIISRFEFHYFVRLLTNVVFYITLFGIPIYILGTLEYIPVMRLNTFDSQSYSYILWYTIGWPNFFYRYSGIWHEPGACQIVLNTILWLNFDKIRRWQLDKNEKYKIFVILFGVILTESTGGYLVLMAFIAAVALTSKIKGQYKALITICLFVIALTAIVIIFTNPVIQAKLFVSTNESESKATRLMDIYALWDMTLDSPMFGQGIGTNEFWEMSKRYGNTTCSSGILTYLASLGFPWLIVTAYFCYKNIKRLKLGMATYFLLASIVMMQMNEKFIEYPITSIFIFRFYSYNNYRRLWKYQLLQFVSIRRKR